MNVECDQDIIILSFSDTVFKLLYAGFIHKNSCDRNNAYEIPGKRPGFFKTGSFEAHEKYQFGVNFLSYVPTLKTEWIDSNFRL